MQPFQKCNLEDLTRLKETTQQDSDLLSSKMFYFSNQNRCSNLGQTLDKQISHPRVRWHSSDSFLQRHLFSSQPCLQDRVCRLSLVVPVKSRKDRAGEFMLWHQRISASSRTRKGGLATDEQSLFLQAVKDERWAGTGGWGRAEKSNMLCLLL